MLTRRPAGRFELADRSHWLGLSQGFRVDSPSGRVGHVVDVRFAADRSTPVALVVAQGRMRRRELVLPVREVAELDLRRRRVLVAEQPGQRLPAAERRPIAGGSPRATDGR